MSRTAWWMGLALVGCAGSKTGGAGAPSPEATEPVGASRAPEAGESGRVGGPSGDPSVGWQDCAAAGGACVGVGDCGVGAGFLSDTSCQSHPGVACCLPACGGATEDFSCCAGSAKFRPTCVGGELACSDGRTRCAP